MVRIFCIIFVSFNAYSKTVAATFYAKTVAATFSPKTVAATSCAAYHAIYGVA